MALQNGRPHIEGLVNYFIELIRILTRVSQEFVKPNMIGGESSCSLDLGASLETNEE